MPAHDLVSVGSVRENGVAVSELEAILSILCFSEFAAIFRCHKAKLRINDLLIFWRSTPIVQDIYVFT